MFTDKQVAGGPVLTGLELQRTRPILCPTTLAQNTFGSPLENAFRSPQKANLLYLNTDLLGEVLFFS